MAIDVNRLSWLVAGEAGYGIMSAGQKFATAMILGGLNVHTHVEYPSLIRGGHNSFGVRVEEDEVRCPIQMYNLVAALNKETIDRHKQFITAGGGIIYDGDIVKLEPHEVRDDIKMYHVPLKAFVRETKGAIPVMRNTAILGASIAVLGWPFEHLANAIRGVQGKRRKASKMAEMNVKMAKKGYDYIKENYKDEFVVRMVPKKHKIKMLLNGNEALAIGAIKAGCKFYSAYPMTPSSSILHYFVAHEEKKGLVMKQADDEITAIHYAIGASYAGVRSMVGTSGGGLALMTEATSLIGITEVPMVIVDCQRPGPATGLPTRQGQGDLKFVLNMGHGEFPRILLAPGDVDECFYETHRAHNLAEKYQLPVFILSDKHLAVSYKSVPKWDTKGMKVERGWLLKDEEARKYHNYKRYMITDSGVSPRAIPGQAVPHRQSSDEHNEYGDFCEEADNKQHQEDKRWRKLDTALQDIPLPEMYGPEKADVTIVSWGSTKGAILEAMDYLKNDGITANFLHMIYIYPMHSQHVLKILKNANMVINIEENKNSQLAGVIREKTGFKIEKRITKYNGRTFYPSEIYDEIKRVYHE